MSTLLQFGETVKAVLVAWKFPDAEKADFDGATNEITIRGKQRFACGKGVRAVLHAVFNVEVFVHCMKSNLPHPGYLVLDKPLLTYRGRRPQCMVICRQTSMRTRQALSPSTSTVIWRA